MIIGKIVSASSHVDYVCQVYGLFEVETPPTPADYGFGTFVALEREGEGYLVGVIVDTVLVNPEFGNLGPRLSPQAELAVFSPDYLVEKATLVHIVALGAVDGRGQVQQGVPIVIAGIDAPVRTLTDAEVRAFHRPGGQFRFAYLPMLTTLQRPLIAHLATHILDRLQALFPEEEARLRTLASHLTWQLRIASLG